MSIEELLGKVTDVQKSLEEVIETPEEPKEETVEVPKEPEEEVIETPEEPKEETVEVPEESKEEPKEEVVETPEEPKVDTVEVPEEPKEEVVEVPKEPEEEEVVETPEEPKVDTVEKSQPQPLDYLNVINKSLDLVGELVKSIVDNKKQDVKKDDTDDTDDDDDSDDIEDSIDKKKVAKSKDKTNAKDKAKAEDKVEAKTTKEDCDDMKNVNKSVETVEANPDNIEKSVPEGKAVAFVTSDASVTDNDEEVSKEELLDAVYKSVDRFNNSLYYGPDSERTKNLIKFYNKVKSTDEVTKSLIDEYNNL